MNKNGFISGFVLGVAAGAMGSLVIRKNKNRMKTKYNYLKMHATIEQKLQGLKKFTREDYNNIIEGVLKEYRNKTKASVAEFDLLKIELKNQWREAKRRFESAIEEEFEDDDEDEKE